MSVNTDLNILLVEDFATVRKMEAKILRDLGFTKIIEAVDGDQALEVLQSGQPVDLIISDWNMPGTDGYALLQWVRAQEAWAGLPFMMATAQGEKKQVALATAAGVSEVVNKPFTPDELRKKIETVFSGGSAAPVAVKGGRTPSLTADGRLRLEIAHIQITDHLILGVLKHQIATGQVAPRHFELETKCMASWNPVAEALEGGGVDGAFVLAPIGMDLFSDDTPIRLLLLAHKNGSICVRNAHGDYTKEGQNFFRHKIFYIPHRLSVHHMLAHMYMSKIGMNPGATGQGDSDVFFEVVPPIRMPELLAANPKAGGFLVAEPLGTKAIASGAAELHFLSGSMWPQHPCCVVTMRQEIIASHPAAVEEFIGCLVEAGRLIKADPEKAAEIAVQFLDPDGSLGLKTAVLKKVLTEKNGITTDDLFPVVADLARMNHYMTGNMGVGSRVDLTAFVDTSFAAKFCQPATGAAGASAAELELDLFEGEEDTQKDKYLTFSLAGESYGLELYGVLEIVGLQKIHPVPDMPPYVRGVINLRGEVITVMDVRGRFGQPERPYDERTCIVVVQDGDTKVGLIVDTVREVLDIPERLVSPPPRITKGSASRFLKGLGRLEDSVVIILNLPRLLAEDADLASLAAGQGSRSLLAEAG